MNTAAPPVSLRDRIGTVLQNNRLLIAIEILLAAAFVMLQVLHLLPIPSVLLLIGSLSLWLHRSSWLRIGLNRPTNW